MPHVAIIALTVQGCEVTSISFNEDGHLLATRAMDDTVKLWDIRKLGGGVVKTFSDVPTHLVICSAKWHGRDAYG